MRRRKYYKTNRRYKEEKEKEEEEEFHIFITIEFILKKKTQKRTGVVLKVLAHLLQNVEDIVGL